MDDVIHLLGDLLEAALREPETGRGEVRGHRLHTLPVAARGDSEQFAEHAVDAISGGSIVCSPDGCDHTSLASLEIARQQLHADETGRTGDEDRLGVHWRHDGGRDRGHTDRRTNDPPDGGLYAAPACGPLLQECTDPLLRV